MSEVEQKPGPLKVGITGGIGSGKTTVCRIFELLGVPVYYADERAKWLMTHDPELRHRIRERFGTEAYLPDGTLNRAFLAKQVFHDPEKLRGLNALVHPAVHADAARWHLEQSRKGASYTLREAALLFESGSYRHLDRMIVVTAPEELRIRRVMQRDGVSREAVRARMRHQWPEAEKAARADFLIQNDGEHLLLPQVLRVHRDLLNLAHKRGESST
ncbi:MAG: dephospho-CoA kinase [Bacteroidetes bacterium]|nr:MAG: dephospho-CoA kinase [Bacteroidota bacterium]